MALSATAYHCWEHLCSSQASRLLTRPMWLARLLHSLSTPGWGRLAQRPCHPQLAEPPRLYSTLWGHGDKWTSATMLFYLLFAVISWFQSTKSCGLLLVDILQWQTKLLFCLITAGGWILSPRKVYPSPYPGQCGYQLFANRLFTDVVRYCMLMTSGIWDALPNPLTSAFLIEKRETWDPETQRRWLCKQLA